MSKPDLPPAMLPPACDLRKFPDMPLDVNRLRKSDARVRTKPEEFRAAIMLWCAAWHEVPAGSVPDDDIGLADLAGYGVAVKEWKRVRAGAIRGFVKCSDGRLYHPVIVAKAIAAWRSLLERKHGTECGRLKKDYQRRSTPEVDRHYPTFDLWITTNVPEAAPFMSLGIGAVVPREKGDGPPEDEPPSPGKRPLTDQIQNIKESNNRFPDTPNIPEAVPSGPLTSTPEAALRVLAECVRAKLENPTAENAIVSRWIRDGATPTQVMNALAEARKTIAAPKPLNARYVDPILTRVMDEDRRARRLAQGRVDSTAKQIAEQRDAASHAAPPPEHVMGKYRKRAA